MSNTSNLKGRFLAAIGYVPRADESLDMAFDRLRTEKPDLLPAPCATESFWDAILEVVSRTDSASGKAAQSVAAQITSSSRGEYGFSQPYSVTLWGSNPDETDNDGCWTGDDYTTREEALAAYRKIVMFPDTPFGNARNADFEFVMLDGPDVHDVTANPDQPSQKRRRRDSAQSNHEWRRERGHGIFDRRRAGLPPRVDDVGHTLLCRALDELAARRRSLVEEGGAP